LVDEATATRYRLIEIEVANASESTIDIIARVEQREAACEKLMRLLVVCGFHGRYKQAELLRRSAEIISTGLYQIGRPVTPVTLYPAALAIYVASLSALANEKDGTAAEMIKVCGVDIHERGRVLHLLARSTGLEESLPAPINGTAKIALSEFLCARCRPFVVEYFVDADRYDLAFDRFEYLLTLVAASHCDEETGGSFHYGRWMEKAALAKRRGTPDMREIIGVEVERADGSWPFLQAGHFGGSTTKL